MKLDDLMVEKPLETALYVVATPIGNLEDITLRALRTLEGAGLIACEDTRVSRKLLRHYGIDRPLISYNEHNADDRLKDILSALKSDKAVTLVTDAGTPLISDPGFRLVRDVTAAGYRVIPIPGPSAPITALCASGLPTEAFHFAGFLPQKKAARTAFLQDHAGLKATTLFFESPKRLLPMLEDAMTVFGPQRQVVVARELTKLHETFVRGTLEAVFQHFQEQGTPKGEIVFLVGPAPDVEVSTALIEARLKKLLPQMRLKEAVAEVAQETGCARRDVYQLALKLKDEMP